MSVRTAPAIAAASGHVFLRHPPLPETHGLCYGRRDVLLARQVFDDAVAALWATPDADVLSRLPVLSSPAQRCLGLARAWLAQIPASADGAVREVAVDPRLLEMDFGDWEGRPWSALPRTDLDRWAGDVAGFRPPGGECFDDLVRRVAAAVAAIRVPHLIVTHAGVIRAAAHLLGAKPIAQAASMNVPHLQPVRFG